MNTFSPEKLFVNVVNKNIVAVKKIKIYSFRKIVKYFIGKLFFMKKVYNTYKKSGVNMATVNKLANYIYKISRKLTKKTLEYIV